MTGASPAGPSAVSSKGTPGAVRITREALRRIAGAAEAAYPAEACGFLLGPAPTERSGRSEGTGEAAEGSSPSGRPGEATGRPGRPAGGDEMTGGSRRPGGPGEAAIVDVLPARNRAGRPDRYFIDAPDVWEAMQEAREAGRELLGVYHSHPDGDPEPSATDVDDAWGEWLHLIIGCRDGTAGEARAWWFRDGGFRPLELVEIDEVADRRATSRPAPASPPTTAPETDA